MFRGKLSGKPLRFYVGLGLILLASGFAWKTLIEKISPIKISGTTLTKPIGLPNVPLLSSDPNVKELNDLRGSFSLVFFGYATCPTICPAALGQMASELTIFESLSGRKNLSSARMVFVTLDPEHDSVEQMKSLVQKFNPEILSVRIEPQHLDQLRKTLGVTRMEASAEDRSTSGPIIHSGDFFLLNRQAEWFALYRPPIAQGVLAQDLFQLTKRPAKF